MMLAHLRYVVNMILKLIFYVKKDNDHVDSFSSNINFLIKKYKNNVYV
jgi:hypothetical protein